MNPEFANTKLPKFFIGKDATEERVRNFRQHKRPHLNLELATRSSNANAQETKAIWYPLEHIETLLNEMKMLNADGLRIYFGAYPYDAESLSAGQLCLLMVPTRPFTDGLGTADDHEDIILEEVPGFIERKAITDAESQAGNNGQASSTLPAGNESETEKLKSFFFPEPVETLALIDKAYNQGFPCPPKCSRGMKYDLDEEETGI